MLGITIQLDISASLTPQVTTNHHHMKKVLLKKIYKNMGGIGQNPYVNKIDT